jgi:hypothetical protein
LASAAGLYDDAVDAWIEHNAVDAAGIAGIEHDAVDAAGVAGIENDAVDAAGIAAGVEHNAVDVARVKKTTLNRAGAAGSAKKMPRADRGHVLRASWLQWKSKRASGESSDRKSYLFHFALPPFGAVERITTPTRDFYIN